MSTSLPFRLASLVMILFVTLGMSPSSSGAGPSQPLQDPSVVSSKQIDFAGIIWNVDRGGDKNLSDSSNSVWVDDQGRLHLTIRYDGSSWRGSQITSTINLRYGPLRFQVIKGDPALDKGPTLDNLDPNMVLGLFTYKSKSGCQNTACQRELDHEFTRWSIPNDSRNAQFAIQPADIIGVNRFRYPLTLAGQTTTTHIIDWQDNLVNFSSFLGTNYNDPRNTLKTWTYTGQDIPVEGDNVKVVIDFWLNDGHPPAFGHGDEVIISDVAIPTLCRPVADLVCGQTIQGSTAGPGSRDQVNSYEISPWPESGREMAYAYKAQTSGLVTLQLSNQTTDQDLFVLSKVSGSACYSTNPNLTYGNQVASFNATAGQTYFVVVDGASESGGSYSLKTDCSGATPPPDPDKVIYHNYLPNILH